MYISNITIKIYNMFNIGCHLSLSNGYKAMGEEALSIQANTFQFFTRNPRGGTAKKLDKKDVEELEDLMKSNNFAPLLAHAPYTYNLCSAKSEIREFAFNTMKDDLERLSIIPCHLYNFHPGSHTGQGVEEGIKQISDALNRLITKDQPTIMLLETMAGKGSEVGRTFEEIAEIIQKVEIKEKMGVCLDTCHIYEAGYDIVNDLDAVIEKFDETIGLNRLYAIHLNDSKNPIGAAKDRHEKIGEGTLGLQTITNVINHPKLRHLPFFLETPNEVEGYQKEIALLRKLYID